MSERPEGYHPMALDAAEEPPFCDYCHGAHPEQFGCPRDADEEDVGTEGAAS